MFITIEDSFILKFTLLVVALLATAVNHAQNKEYPIRKSSQNPFWELQSRQIEIEKANEFLGENPNSVENIEGSPYANETFVFGSLYIDAKLHKKNVLLRYNIFSEEIEISTGSADKESSYDALLKDPSYHARIGQTSYIFVAYNASNEDGGYFAFIANGDPFHLYEKAKAKFVKATEPRPYAPSKSAKFLRSIAYYLVSKDGKFFKIPTKHARLVKEWEGYKNELKTFLKDHAIDLNKKEDVLNVFNFYNTLVSNSD